MGRNPGLSLWDTIIMMNHAFLISFLELLGKKFRLASLGSGVSLLSFLLPGKGKVENLKWKSHQGMPHAMERGDLPEKNGGAEKNIRNTLCPHNYKLRRRGHLCVKNPKEEISVLEGTWKRQFRRSLPVPCFWRGTEKWSWLLKYRDTRKGLRENIYLVLV